MQTPYELLSKIDSFFFAQYRVNKLDCGYESSIRENKLTISDFAGNVITFEVTEKYDLRISKNDCSLDIDIATHQPHWLNLVDYFSQLVISMTTFVETLALRKEPKSYKTNKVELSACKIKKLGVIPSNDVYYDLQYHIIGKKVKRQYKFFGTFYAPSKNIARKINNRLGI